MKQILCLLAALAMSPLAVAAEDEVSTPTISARGTAVYGEAMPLGRPLDIASALADDQTWNRRRGKFEGKITSVCQNKGCWLVLTEGGHEARVFSGHKFFLPKDTSGRAIVYGTLSRRVLSEAFARHLAEDAGADPSQVSGEQVEYRIDAHSVEILPAG